MKKYKDVELVALDIDGTLLDDNLCVSDKVVNKIKEVSHSGIKVVLISGRTHKAAEMIRKRINLDIPVVSYNSGIVKMYGQKKIYEKKIPNVEALKIIKYGEKHNLYVKVYIDDVLYVEEDGDNPKEFSIANGISYKVVGKLSNNIHDDVNMIVMYFKNEVYIEDFTDDELINIKATITRSAEMSLDFIPEGISKDVGLKIVAKELGVDCENILAVGNNMNDLEMLKCAGIGIAMKNSDSKLLEQWEVVSEYTNNEDGVYYILDDLL